MVAFRSSLLLSWGAYAALPTISLEAPSCGLGFDVLKQLAFTQSPFFFLFPSPKSEKMSFSVRIVDDQSSTSRTSPSSKVQGDDLLLQIFTSSILQRQAGEEAPFLEFIQHLGHYKRLQPIFVDMLILC